MTPDEHDEDQTEEQATVLSEREAMSLIAPDAGTELLSDPGVPSGDKGEQLENHDSPSIT